MKLERAFEIISEMEKNLKDKQTGILVLDIDDTLLKANPNVIKIYKSVDGKEQPLSTEQFATDLDKKAMGKNVRMYDKVPPATGIAFSIREFRNPTKVYESITKGTPIVRNLRLMDDYLNRGWDICFLTARGLQSTVEQALDKFLLHKTKDGEFIKIGEQFKKALSAAVNDEDIKYAGIDDGDKKARILKKLSQKYTYVKFLDDDERNLKATKALGISNLQAIKAAKL